MEKSPIQQVKEILNSIGVDEFPKEEMTNAPFEIALFNLGLDDKNRPLVLQVQQLTKKIEELIPKEDREGLSLDFDFLLLTFLVTCPVEIPTKTSNEVRRLLALANQGLLLGSINLSEIEKSAYFSYNLPLFTPNVSDKVILSLLTSFLSAKDNFFPLIDLVSSGQFTVDALLKETIQASQT